MDGEDPTNGRVDNRPAAEEEWLSSRDESEASPPSLTPAAAAAAVPFHVGGPTTRLPFAAESLLGWILCLSCLAVSGYHYCRAVLVGPALRRRVGGGGLLWRRVRRALPPASNATGVGKFDGNGGSSGVRDDATGNDRRCESSDAGEDRVDDFRRRVPLTTHCRAEIDRATPLRRFRELEAALLERCPRALASPVDADADDALVGAVRDDDVCRRLASLAMRPVLRPGRPACAVGTTKTMTTTLANERPDLELVSRMSRLWHRFLALPTLEECVRNGGDRDYRISLILPAHRECGLELGRKLRRARDAAADPGSVEVVVVDAGGCVDLEGALLQGQTARRTGTKPKSESDEGPRVGSRDAWGRVSVVRFTSGGGRGPCLNHGAQSSRGRILVFCHSDTTLPERWDNRIATALEGESSSSDGVAPPRANSCAFSFGINTSPEALAEGGAWGDSDAGGYFPPGIRAVETTANMRTHMYSLPYGDQVISLHARVFHFLGGFPDQCLMEDYELVSLLRTRASVVRSPPSDVPSRAPDEGGGRRERLAVIGGTPALCSPRRWQKYGVLHVTLTNSRLVNLYAGGLGPDDLYRIYYRRDLPQRECAESPWELELRKILKDGDR